MRFRHNSRVIPRMRTWAVCAASLASANAVAFAVDGSVIEDRIFASGFEFPPPALRTLFVPPSVPAGTTSMLVLTLDNTAVPEQAILVADLVDNLPAGLAIASPANATNSCPSGAVQATAGGSTLTLTSGARVPAGSTCAVTVSVISSTAGTYTNTIPAGALQTDHGASASATSSELTVTPGSGCTPAQLFADPGFETTDSGTLVNPSWPGTSTNFGVPFCSVSICGNFGGTAAPLSGLYWALFGGANGAAEDSTIEQTVTIPSGSPRYVNFWLRIGVLGHVGAVLTVDVDGNVLATYPEPATAESAYTQRNVDVSSYADDAPHTIRFHYNTPAGAASNFSVDYVRLECVPSP